MNLGGFGRRDYKHKQVYHVLSGVEESEDGALVTARTEDLGVEMS